MKTSNHYVPPRGSRWDGLLQGVADELARLLPVREHPEAEPMVQQPIQQQQAEPIEGQPADKSSEAPAKKSGCL